MLERIAAPPSRVGPALLVADRCDRRGSAVNAAPTPTPEPVATPAAIEQMPVVLVYPFDVQTGADPRIGMAIAQILAQEMVAAGGITVPPVPQGVKRADFLENARTAQADFYISGYVTPVGDSAAVVEQVVSVESGVILFSQTAQVSSVADVASQSLLARSQILAFVGRGTQSVQTQPANTPAPSSTNGAQVPIQGLGSIVNSVFKHKGGAARPSPSPVVKAVARRDRRAGHGRRLRGAGRSHQRTARALLRAQRPFQRADDRDHVERRAIDRRDLRTELATTRSRPERCKSPPHTTVKRRSRSSSASTRASAQSLEREVGKGTSIKSAVDAAVTAYANAHPDNS